MELQLVESGDMASENKTGEELNREEIGKIGIEDYTTNIDEFIPEEDIKESMVGAFELALSALEAEGYESFTEVHPRYGRKVTHLVKGETVIVADYSGTNLLTFEVLPNNEATIIIEGRKFD